MDVKLIALDLDGTLLLPDKTLSPRNRAALEAAAAQGIHLVPTTGRLYEALPAVLRELPFIRYAITVNGGQVYDSATRTVLHTAYLPLELCMRIYDYLDTLPVLYDCYLDGRAYMRRDFYEQLPEFIYDNPAALQMVQKLRKPVDDFRGLLLKTGHDLQKLQFFLKNPDDRRALAQELNTRFPETVSSFSMAHNVEVNHRNATKGEGVRMLCEHLQIPLSQAACFGDNYNDISMLKTAGISVAMGNAEPEALAAAKFVTATNAEDGVAQFIESHFLK